MSMHIHNIKSFKWFFFPFPALSLAFNVRPEYQYDVVHRCILGLTWGWWCITFNWE